MYTIPPDASETGVSFLEKMAFHTTRGLADIRDAATLATARRQERPHRSAMLDEAIYPIQQQQLTPGR